MKIESINIMRLLVCIGAGLSIQASADDNIWSTNGPNGGRVFTIAVNPLNSEIVFLGTVENGMFKSTDAGESWAKIVSDSLSNTIRVIAIHPINPDAMYAATVRGIYKSIDAGDTWHLLQPPDGVFNEYRALLLHPIYHDVIFAGGPMNEWKSTNGGETWVDICIDSTFRPFDVGIQAICSDAQNPNKLYIATNSMGGGMGAYKSTDLGEHWQRIQNNIDSTGWGWNIAADPIDTNILYYARRDDWRQSGGRFLSKSTDGGDSWSDISPDSLAEWGVLEIRVSPYDHNTLFICSTSDGVLKSTDGGTTWQRKNSGLKGWQAKTIVFDTLSGALYLGLYFDGIYKSTDMGESWRRISQNINIFNAINISSSADHPSNLYVTGQTGLSLSRDYGNTWQFPEIEISPYNYPDGLLLVENNPGLVLVSTSSRSYTMHSPCGVYRSTDSGVSWEFITQGLLVGISYGDFAVSISPIDCKIFLCSDLGLFYSEDLGQSWSICVGGAPDDIGIAAIAISLSDPNEICLIGQDYGIYKSRDRGVNWAQISELPHPHENLIEGLVYHPTDPSILFVSIGNIGLCKTFDAGVHWEPFNGNLPLNLYPEVSIPVINTWNPLNMFITSSGYGVFISNNGGLSWEQFNSGLDSAHSFGNMIFAPYDTSLIFIATIERSVWSIHRTLDGIDDNGEPLPSKLSLASYPNPFNPSTNISYSLPQAGQVSIAVYNITGQKVATISDSYQQAGEHSIIWNAASYPSGLYFAKLECRASNQTIKMLLVK